MNTQTELRSVPFKSKFERDETKLWRFMDLPKVLDLLLEKRLTLARLKKHIESDPFECSAAQIYKDLTVADIEERLDASPETLAARPFRARGDDDWENPMIRCGIALAGANHASGITNAVAEDGLLTGLEASQLNLQGTELVILSACQTGVGDIKIGEGVMSLRRAFRIAGAETVLASHWPVSDKATKVLMTEFIRRWNSGEPRGKAWREAQLSLLNSKEFSNPYFWASFTLTGQWR
ncbi:MAG: kinesin light chain [Verrucomicrobiales bacterium]|nr:kinesin light chain [Verrucomicrobiales bacterium]